MAKSVISLILIIMPWFFIRPAYATQNEISTTFETGERSVTDTLEDRDLSGNLNFYQYALRFDHAISKLTKYNFSYGYDYKNYQTLDALDSTSHQWHFGLDHTFENFKANPLKLDIDVGLRNKDYRNSPSSDYERTNASLGLEYKHEDLWAISWRNGFINYDFTKAGNDQLKLFTKLGGWSKLFNERLKIDGFYKFQNVDHETASKGRVENTLNLGSSYKLEMPYFSKLSGVFETGKTDTKDSEYEDRDDNLQFKYTKWHVATAHPLLKNITTFFRYGRISRDYQNSNNGYKNWFAENKTDFEILEDKIKKVNLSILAEHKESNYDLTDSLNYIRNLASAKFSYKMKNNWEFDPSFAFKKYDYSANPLQNEKQYEIKAEFAKELYDGNLELKLTYKFVWKDYENNPDVNLWSIKAGIDYKF